MRSMKYLFVVAVAVSVFQVGCARSKTCCEHVAPCQTCYDQVPPSAGTASPSDVASAPASFPDAVSATPPEPSFPESVSNEVLDRLPPVDKMVE